MADIDPTKPTEGMATTLSVRNNFQACIDQDTNLQNQLDIINQAIDISATSLAMTIDNAGKVGIGGAPSTRLTVVETAAAGQVASFKSTGASFSYISVYDTTGATQTAVLADATMGTVGTISNSTFRIITNNAGRVYVDSAGNVGIGTQSPAQKLDVVNKSGSCVVRIESGSANSSQVSFHNSTQQTAALYSYYNAGAPYFAIFNDGSERMRIDSAGNVIIANSTAVPGTPAGGGVLYVEAGALKYKGSSGTVTVIGPA